MKINFNASFKELSKVLDRPLRKDSPAQESENFSSLISSLIPQESRLEKTANVSSAIGTKETLTEPPRDEPMASLGRNQARLELPKLDPIDLAPLEDPIVNPGTPSVKTPAVISVTRMKGAELLDHVSKLFGEAGTKHGIDPALGAAVAKAESSFNPSAVSTDGHRSKGLMQLLDSTGKDMLAKLGVDDDYDPFNPDQNVDLGVGYLRYLHDLFNSPTELPRFGMTRPAANSSSLEKLAVAAFNAGEGRVASAQARAEKAGKDASVYEDVEKYLPETTQEYVRKVLEFKDSLKGSFES